MQVLYHIKARNNVNTLAFSNQTVSMTSLIYQSGLCNVLTGMKLITLVGLEMVKFVLFCGDGPVMVDLLFNCCFAGR